MSPYEGSFYLMVGVLSVLIAHRIQDWLVRRRFDNFFGFSGVFMAKQEKVDSIMQGLAVRLNASNKGHRDSAKREFRRGQRLAKHFGYKVWDEYTFPFSPIDLRPAGKTFSNAGAYWPEEERFQYGTEVITTEDAGGTDWSEGSRAKRMWGAKGVVIDRSDAHGLCYLVRHKDGSTVWYDPEELSDKVVSALGFVNG